MDFSESFVHSDLNLVEWSPSGEFVASIEGHRVVVRERESLALIALFIAVDKIDHLEWSPESEHILVGCFQRGICHIFSLEDKDKSASIDEGALGMKWCGFIGAADKLYTVTDHNMRISIWDLSNGDAKFLPHPKGTKDRCIATSRDGHIAFIHRQDAKDSLVVVDSRHMEVISHTALETEDAVALKWSPTEPVLAVCDSSFKCAVFIYRSNGTKLGEFKKDVSSLGIRSMAFSPTGQHLAIGLFSGTTLVLNHLTWGVSAKMAPTILNTRAVCYQEVSSTYESKYAVSTSMELEECQAVDPKKPNPKRGVSLITWSPCNRYLSCKIEHHPRTVYVFDVQAFSLCSIIRQVNPVTCLDWNPKTSLLCISTDSCKIFFWSPESVSAVSIPMNQVRGRLVKWASTGSAVAVLDLKAVLVAYYSELEASLQESS